MAESPSQSQPSVSERRRERERNELTQRIMDVAREMFVRDGYEAVTLRKIAKAVEYSPGAIYQYFADKKSLVMELVNADYADLRAHLLECRDIADPLERLLEMARRYARWGADHPNHYRMLMMQPPGWTRRTDEDRQRTQPPMEEDAIQLFRSVVEEVRRADVIRPEYAESQAVAATLWAGIHGVVTLEITLNDADRRLLGVEQVPFDERVEMLINVIVRGLHHTGDQ